MKSMVVVAGGNIAAAAVAVVQFVGMNYLNAHDVEISIVIVVCVVGVAVFVPAAVDSNCSLHHYAVAVDQYVDELEPSLTAFAYHCYTADFAGDDCNFFAADAVA